jgi:hypothetical protein
LTSEGLALPFSYGCEEPFMVDGRLSPALEKELLRGAAEEVVAAAAVASLASAISDMLSLRSLNLIKSHWRGPEGRNERERVVVLLINRNMV